MSLDPKHWRCNHEPTIHRFFTYLNKEEKPSFANLTILRVGIFLTSKSPYSERKQAKLKILRRPTASWLAFEHDWDTSEQRNVLERQNINLVWSRQIDDLVSCLVGNPSDGPNYHYPNGILLLTMTGLGMHATDGYRASNHSGDFKI